MIMNCIIVGLDDSAASRAAHRWAAQYAYAAGKDLCAVHVMDWPVGLNASAAKSGTRLRVPKHDVAEPYWRGIRRVFDEASSPNGSILRFAQGDVAEVLVRLSTDADLLVVGTREPMRGGRYLAGSVSHYCISHAICPVVAVPEQLSELQHGLPEECTRHHDLGHRGAELDDATAAISGPLTALHRPCEGRPLVVDRSAAAAQPIQLGPAPRSRRHHADPGNITAIHKEER